MKFKYLGALAGLAFAAPAANATVVTINYAPVSDAILGGPVSGTLTFDTNSIDYTVYDLGARQFAQYTSPSFKHTYNLFGEILTGSFGLQMLRNVDNNFAALYFYTPIPDTEVNLNLVLEWGDAPFAGFDLPAFGYEGAAAFVAFVVPSQGVYAALGPATYSVSYANSVPEPATWAMMIGGMGMIGGTLRRRRPSRSVAIAA